MDDAAARALKLLVLLGMSLLFLVGGLWAYLGPGLVLGLAGPVFALFLVLYVVNDAYANVFAG